MKNIIPFKKDVIFKTNLSEITSISLENTLTLIKDAVKGEFIISGEYKISDNSKTVEPFEIKLPFEIIIDERYDTSNSIIDIDDFYYEIVNNNVLSVSIDVMIDKLKEKRIIEENTLDNIVREKEIVPIDEIDSIKIENKKEEDQIRICEIEEENMNEKTEENIELDNDRKIINDKSASLFAQFKNEEETYSTYNIFIVREGDNVDSILEKYNISIDELKEYNDLSDLKLGDKLIIPCKYERN